MKNAISVYSGKGPIKGKRLVELAESQGVRIRYLGLGGHIPSEGETLLTQSMAAASGFGGGRLVAGWLEPDGEQIGEYDRLVAARDQTGVAGLLNGGEIAWCELYVSKFDYEKTVAGSPKDKAAVDGSVDAKDLPTVRSARTRYIFYNQSRRKQGQRLAECLAKITAEATDGVLANDQRSKR